MSPGSDGTRTALPFRAYQERCLLLPLCAPFQGVVLFLRTKSRVVKALLII